MPNMEPIKDLTLDGVGTALIPFGLGSLTTDPYSIVGWITLSLGIITLFYKYERRSKPKDHTTPKA